MELSGQVSSGVSALLISTCYASGQIVDLGGTGVGTGDLRLSSSELSLLTSVNLTVRALGSGWIRVQGVSSADLSNVAGPVLLDASGAGGAISFLVSSTWRALQARAGAGLNVSANIATTAGDLMLEGNADYLQTAADPSRFSIDVNVASVSLVANSGSLYVGASNQAGTVGVVAPSSWNATGSITVYPALSVWSGSGVVAWSADTDGNAVGSVVLSATSNVSVAASTASLFALSGADVDLLCTVGGVIAGSCPISVVPSATSIGMKLGGSNTATFYLSASEVNLLQSSSWLLFGGTPATSLVVDGLSYTGGASPVQLWSLSSASASSSVTFSGGASVFGGALDVRALGSIVMTANVTGMHSGSVSNGGSVGVLFAADFGACPLCVIGSLFVCLFVFCLSVCLFVCFLFVFCLCFVVCTFSLLGLLPVFHRCLFMCDLLSLL
jgi:hypothetical protein